MNSRGRVFFLVLWRNYSTSLSGPPGLWVPKLPEPLVTGGAGFRAKTLSWASWSSREPQYRRQSRLYPFGNTVFRASIPPTFSFAVTSWARPLPGWNRQEQGILIESLVSRRGQPVAESTGGRDPGHLSSDRCRDRPVQSQLRASGWLLTGLGPSCKQGGFALLAEWPGPAATTHSRAPPRSEKAERRG